MQKSWNKQRNYGSLLRHSFATHLLENGVDPKYIQELLRHKSSKTTEIYMPVAMKNLRKIASPLDMLGVIKRMTERFVYPSILGQKANFVYDIYEMANQEVK